MYKKVQMKLSLNKNRAPRLGQSSTSPLSGLVRCGRCGAAMSVFRCQNSRDKSKGYHRYFRCITREQKSKLLYDNSSISADELGKIVIDHIKGLSTNQRYITSLLESSNDELENKCIPLIAQRNKLQSELDNMDKEMSNLVIALGKDSLPEIVIRKRFKELENQKLLRSIIKEIKVDRSNVTLTLHFSHQEFNHTAYCSPLDKGSC